MTVINEWVKENILDLMENSYYAQKFGKWVIFESKISKLFLGFSENVTFDRH